MSDHLNATPLPVSEWDSSLALVIDDMNGQPLNVHKLMANNPALLRAWWDLRNHAVHGGGLQKRHRELIVLRVAVHMRSGYEWASHVDRGLKAGLTVGEIERVRSAAIDPTWSDSDSLVLRAIDECFHERQISAVTRKKMLRFFDLQQVMDLIAIYGVYVTIGVMINTWQIDLDDFIKLPPGMRHEAWPQP